MTQVEAESYEAVVKKNTEDEIDLVEGLGLRVSDRLLDIGCGPGRHCVELAMRGYKNVMGLNDFIHSGLSENRQLFRSITGTDFFIQADWGQMPFPGNYFDSAISFGTGAIDGKIDEVSRVLKPGGKFLYTAHYWEDIQNQEVDDEGVMWKGVTRTMMVPGTDKEFTFQPFIKLDKEKQTKTQASIIFEEGEPAFETDGRVFHFYTREQELDILRNLGLSRIKMISKNYFQYVLVRKDL